MKSLQDGVIIFIFCIYTNSDFGKNTCRADGILYFCYIRNHMKKSKPEDI